VLKPYPLRNIRADQYVMSVFVDRSEQVWAGTYPGGLFQLSGSEFQPSPGSGAIGGEVSAFYQDRKNQLWAGTRAGLARREGEVDFLFWPVGIGESQHRLCARRRTRRFVDGLEWRSFARSKGRVQRLGRFTLSARERVG